MKMRKIPAILLALALLTFPAFAATTDLPSEPTLILSDNQVAWVTNGTDEIATDLTLDQVKAAKFLVLEITEVPEGGFQFVVQSDGDGWAWNQLELTTEDVYADGKLIFDFSKMTMGGIADATQFAKLFVCYYTDDVTSLGITKAYLTDSLDGGGAADTGAAATGNAKTGDSTALFFALGALILAAVAVVLIVRKVRV